MRDAAGRSRRAMLGGALALAGGASLALAGCGGHGRTGAHSVHKAPDAIQQTDIALLARLLDLERRTVAAYTAGIPLLDRDQGKVAKQFLDLELQHTGELISLIKAAGGKALPRAAPFDLGHPRDATGVLVLLHSLEQAQIALYLQTIPRLAPGPVRAAAATIVASDAQHLAVLRSLQGRPPMPSAFVTGSA
ncbi:MAG TPA: ferritin-like domain-containing protein [Solirubrobacteraceae bacterium]|nr:ferritin-like domain-containing protein [Solirubrobacteraceae bacterium]